MDFGNHLLAFDPIGKTPSCLFLTCVYKAGYER